MKKFAAIAGVAVWLLASWAHAAEFKQIKLPGKPPALFTIDPDSGALLAADSAGVTLYPNLSGALSTDGAITHDLPDQPVAMVYKKLAGRECFLVGCERGVVHVLDAATLAEIRSIDVGRSITCLATPANRANPYVFYSCPVEGTYACVVGCFDTASWKNTVPLAATSTVTLDFQDFAVSANGRVLFGRRLHSSPSGLFECTIKRGADGAPVEVYGDQYVHNSVTPFRVDPFSDGIICATDDGKPAVASPFDQIPGKIVGFSSAQPLIFAVNGHDFGIYSYNTCKLLDSVAIHREMWGDYEMLVDEKNQQLLICWNGSNEILDLSLKDLKLPTEPILTAWLKDGDVTLAPGQAVSLPLAEATPGASLSLVDGPPGMKLAGDRLEWTPDEDHIGQIDVRIKVTLGALEHVQALSLTVRRPMVTLAFKATRLALSADGKTAAVLGGLTNDQLMQPMNGQSRPPSQLALIDLDRVAVTASRTLSVAMRDIAMDDQYVYAVAADADAVYVYARKDLGDVRRIFLPGRINSLGSAGGVLYVQSANGVCRFPTDTFKPIDSEATPASARLWPGLGVAARAGDDWWAAGIVYDADCKKIVRIESDPEFVEVARQDNSNPFGIPPDAYGLMMRGTQLMRMPQQQIGNLPSGVVAFLPDAPAVACLILLDGNTAEGSAPVSDPMQRMMELQYFDLSSAAPVASVKLQGIDPPYPIEGFGIAAQGVAIAAAPGRVVVLVRDKLFVAATPAGIGAHLSQPISARLDPAVPVVDPAAKDRVAIVAAGGKAPLDFAAPRGAQGYDVDAATKTITIDGPAMMDLAVAAVAQTLGQRPAQTPFRRRGGPVVNPPSPPVSDPAKLVDAYCSAASNEYQSLTGKAPAGVPVLVPLDFQVIDNEQQTAIVHAMAFICVPKQKVIAALSPTTQP